MRELGGRCVPLHASCAPPKASNCCSTAFNSIALSALHSPFHGGSWPNPNFDAMLDIKARHVCGKYRIILNYFERLRTGACKFADRALSSLLLNAEGIPKGVVTFHRRVLPAETGNLFKSEVRAPLDLQNRI